MTDIRAIRRRLERGYAFDAYDCWRALKTVDQELYALGRRASAVPIELLRMRRLLEQLQVRLMQTGLDFAG